MPLSLVARRRLSAVALAAVAVALAWLLLSGGDEPEPEVDATAGTSTTTTGTAETPVRPVRGSPEELVDAALLVGIEGTQLDAATKAELEEHPPGGVLIGAANWASRRAGARLIAEVGKAVPKALIVTRQEGGPYRSLPDLPPEQREIEIGDEADLELAAEWAGSTAKALRDVGIDLNLAPVADVATLDSPIADRAFSDDPAVVSEMTLITEEECERVELVCAPAHFPGLGGGTADTDQGPSSISIDSATLLSRDLMPFVAAFDSGVPAVVVGHGLFVAYNPVTPASLAPEISTQLLRDELGFSGAAISDDISAGAVAAFAKPGPSAVAAMVAGIDLVQVADPGDVKPVRKALVQAAEAGILTRERLSQAAGRVAALLPVG